MDIRLPDGRILRGVPEGTTKAQIAEKLGVTIDQLSAKPEPISVQQEQTEQPESTLKDRLQGYGEHIAQSPTIADVPLRTAASGFRASGDVMATGLGAITPEFIKEPLKSGFSYGLNKLYNLPTGDGKGNSIGDAASQAYSSLKAVAPKNVGRLEDSLVILFSALPSSNVGKNIVKAGKKAAVKAKKEFIKKMVTEGVTEDAILQGRVKDTILGRQIIPSAFEEEMIDQVAKLPKVSKLRTIINNTNLVLNKANENAESLLKNLKTSNVTFKPQAINRGIESIAQNLKKNPQLITDTTGELLPSARQIINIYKDTLDQFPLTPAGLLEARRAFDKKIKSMSGNIIDPKFENAKSIVTRELRTKTNDLIDSYMQNADVKKSLREQHLLYSAAEEMAKNGKKTAATGAGRLTQYTLDKIPLKGEIAGLAALGGLSTAGYLNPYVAGAGLGAYGAYKGATLPISQIATGNVVQALESSKVPQLLLLGITNKDKKKSVVFKKGER